MDENLHTDKQKLIEEYRLEIEGLKFQISMLSEENKRLSEGYLQTVNEYLLITDSIYWKITKPIRSIVVLLKKVLKKSKLTRYPAKALRLLLKKGPKSTFRAIKDHFHLNTSADLSKISNKRRELEESVQFPKNIKFSILVPLYNTPMKYLAEMIESVQNQTYKNWELCLADGSDSEHENVGEFVKELQARDKRIVYKKLEKNLGISENTNECIRISTGDYICLFDHDDYLHPSALYENMKAICEQNADFIYTDEAVFLGNDIKKIITYHLKPDFALDNLRANNYICHFSVFSRELLEKSGMFRSDYDGSQDHDIILRLTSNAKKVFHIRKILYFWRSHANSVAMDINSKTYAINAGIRAVHDSIVACGEQCEVESSTEYPTIYRIKYELKEKPLISILIHSISDYEKLRHCINDILFRTSYQNYEILIAKRKASNSEAENYFKELSDNEKIRIIDCGENNLYAAINTLAGYAKGKHIVLLNANTEVLTVDWIQEMLMYSQRDNVGAVGAKILYPNNRIRHAGLIVGSGDEGVAFTSHNMVERDSGGYMGKLAYSQNVSAVSCECLMVKKELFDSLAGFDTAYLKNYADVDFCLRLGQLGFLTVFTPYSELIYYKNRSNTAKTNKDSKSKDIAYFKKKWNDNILKKGDPYYNPNLSLSESYRVLYGKITKESYN